MNNNCLIVILGPTATGKTHLAAQLAHKISGEVTSADSRQVYKGMDVGTGKDLADFEVNGVSVPYHLIDIINAGEEYNVFQYQQDFLIAYQNILKRKKQAILCGGTGMYLESVLKGYRMIEIPANEKLREELQQEDSIALINLLKRYKKLHNTTDSIDRDRIIRAIEIAKFEEENEELIQDFPKIDYQLYGIYFEREELKKRITERLKHRFKHEDMIGEVEQLMASGVAADKLKFYGLEYKLITQFLLGEITRQELFEQLNIAIHQFSKRQMTWFRKMERNGFEINWLDGNLSTEEKINSILKK
ncbi:MAG: tRNA (adenosine(37)-N6)-dimethylallyltransferase MiaA [Vicingus serpentipes]|nr:tRNA (adenosine(37)-N6)-dimethylallyltransferase MiaA [Vicingus serpentipes]